MFCQWWQIPSQSHSLKRWFTTPVSHNPITLDYPQFGPLIDFVRIVSTNLAICINISLDTPYDICGYRRVLNIEGVILDN